MSSAILDILNAAGRAPLSQSGRVTVIPEETLDAAWEEFVRISGIPTFHVKQNKQRPIIPRLNDKPLGKIESP